ncbi:MAG: hypothetical protein CMI09_10335 [Oceanospirillaceae bacterium]|nr:hypothetical protein [Oceanospirillaceae bacterium]|tara:strand:- start:2378 stop:2848 length:471 start_codon:yes stop_codon:yes gene_type:complete
MANRHLLYLGLFGLLLQGCDSSPDITSSTAGRPTPDGSGNSFFNAIEMTSESTVATTSDNEVFYKFSGPSAIFQPAYSGTVTLGLSGLTGNADLELYDRNLNLISWSRESDTASEEIVYWYSNAKFDSLILNGLHFVRIRNASGSTLDYNLTFRFE